MPFILLDEWLTDLLAGWLPVCLLARQPDGWYTTCMDILLGPSMECCRYVLHFHEIIQKNIKKGWPTLKRCRAFRRKRVSVALHCRVSLPSKWKTIHWHKYRIHLSTCHQQWECCSCFCCWCFCSSLHIFWLGVAFTLFLLALLLLRFH